MQGTRFHLVASASPKTRDADFLVTCCLMQCSNHTNACMCAGVVWSSMCIVSCAHLCLPQAVFVKIGGLRNCLSCQSPSVATYQCGEFFKLQLADGTTQACLTAPVVRLQGGCIRQPHTPNGILPGALSLQASGCHASAKCILHAQPPAASVGCPPCRQPKVGGVRPCKTFPTADACPTTACLTTPAGLPAPTPPLGAWATTSPHASVSVPCVGSHTCPRSIWPHCLARSASHSSIPDKHSGKLVVQDG